jgi:hypothetical protein
MTFGLQAFVRHFGLEFLTFESDRVSGLTQASKMFVTACQSCSVGALREAADELPFLFDVAVTPMAFG